MSTKFKHNSRWKENLQNTYKIAKAANYRRYKNNSILPPWLSLGLNLLSPSKNGNSCEHELHSPKILFIHAEQHCYLLPRISSYQLVNSELWVFKRISNLVLLSERQWKYRKYGIFYWIHASFFILIRSKHPKSNDHIFICNSRNF